MLKFGRATREFMIKELTMLFQGNSAGIVTRFQNIDVNKIQRLKKPLKASSTRFKIVKNSMARIAAKNSNLEFLEPLFEETCAIGFCDQDAIINVSRIFVNFSKENDNFKICGGYLTGEFIPSDKIKDFAMLPPREILLARAVGGIKSPISAFVGVLNNLVSGFVRVVEEIRKKKG